MKLPRPALPFVVLITIGLFTLSSRAEESVDFNRDIRSLLSNNCLMCHGPDEAERAADLRLDTQDGAHADLGGYAAVKPGDPENSELFSRIASDDEDVIMPPTGKGKPLSKEEIELVRRWIQQGGKYDKHWSYQLPDRRVVPKVDQSDWPTNPVDRFVLARLEQEGLRPSPAADRLAIARRLSLDLTGLPPTWEEATSFAADQRDNAYELYVDSLLAKQSFGERWGRVWLDLARYADSAGYADDPPRTIWAFRDYVIRSLNENKPFDQFTIEQIAGDLLDDPTEEQLTATAFHRNTLTNNEGGTNNEEFRNVAVVDRVNTTMAVWMGTTMACAQCHTHKYDPITHEEYFKFFAFFNNSEDADQRDERPTIQIWSDEQEQSKADLANEIARLKKSLDTPTDDLAAAQARWLTTVSGEPTWQTLTPLTAKGQKRELKIEYDGWVVGQGDKPDTDVYSLRYQTDCIESLSGLRIEVPAEQKDNFVVSQIQADWLPSGDDRKGQRAQFVRVELPGNGKFIHLAELQIFSDGKNVALGGKASQSSTGFGGEVTRVNDGNTDGDYQKNSVSHTDSGNDPWLEIDLGDTMLIERVAVWNRTDGGQSIIDRLKGYKLQLLDADRKVVWEQSPSKVPSPSAEFAFKGGQTIHFVSALADHQQKGFPAESVLAGKIDKKKGWAIAPQTGKPHELTLVTDKPVTLGAGVLTIRIRQNSSFVKHLLDRFRVTLTDSQTVAAWAKMPKHVRQLILRDRETWSKADNEKVATFYRSIAPLLNAQRKSLRRAEQSLAKMKPYTTVPVMRDLPSEKHRTTNIQIRGNYLSKGDEVTQGTPVAFHPLPADRPKDRMALAQWLIDDANPLTARVIANRHWEQLFGTGIVATSEEFGSQGDLPSHPELLDWLAVELRESGWDIKHLIKLLVMSSTYRQSSVTTAEAMEDDPFNRLLARGPRFRISAEMVRDQALSVSGLLSNKMFGPPVKPPQPQLGLKAAFGSATDWKTSAGDDKYRRGIYTNWRRSSPYPSMAQFDAPNREVCTVRRTRTNTPLQALVTMNDPVYIEAAQSLARRMIDASDSVDKRIAFAFQLVLTRNPTEAELQRLSQFVDDAKKQYSSDKNAAMKMATDPLGPLPDGADPAEFAAWTVVANVILNLDEMFMKR